MSKKIQIIVAPFFLLFIAGIFLLTKKTPNTLPVIAMSQIIDHNTLNVVRQGILDEFKDQGYENGKNIKFNYENAQGNLTVATQIAKQFASISPKVYIGLSTQTSQAFFKMASMYKIPLVFTAVTNPAAAQLIKEDGTNYDYITGVSDYMAPEQQIDLLKSFLPNLKTIGFLYNPSEINSVSYLEKFKKACNKAGLKIVYAPVNSTSEAGSAVRSLVGKVDAAYFPNDNTVMACVKSIAPIAIKYNLPLFANDVESVKRGALAALSYDRNLMGRITAKIAIQILKGAKPETIPVVYDVPIETVYNSAAIEKVKLKLPQLSNARDVAELG